MVRRTESAPAASPARIDAPALALLPVSQEPAASGRPPTAPRPMPGLHLGTAKSAGAEDVVTPTPRGSKTPRADPGGPPFGCVLTCLGLLTATSRSARESAQHSPQLVAHWLRASDSDAVRPLTSAEAPKPAQAQAAAPTHDGGSRPAPTASLRSRPVGPRLRCACNEAVSSVLNAPNVCLSVSTCRGTAVDTGLALTGLGWAALTLQKPAESSDGELNTESEGTDSDSDDSASDVSLA
jgi:hypothetical protein